MPTTMAEREEITRGGSSGNGGGPGPVYGAVSRLGEYPRRFKQFVHESRLELKHVSWPTREDVKATTVVVLVTIFVFGAFLFGVDSVVSWAVQKVLGAFR